MKVTSELVHAVYELIPRYCMIMPSHVRTALEAALADVPEPGSKEPGPFVLTPREQDCLTHDVDCPGCGSVFRQALDRACRTLGPQAVSAPTGDVRNAVRVVLQDYLAPVGDFDTRQEYEEYEKSVVQRVLEVITAPAPTGDVLTAEEREAAEALRERGSYDRADIMAIIDRLAPAPKPVEKTARELGSIVATLSDVTCAPAAQEALDELVRRAEKGEVA